MTVAIIAEDNMCRSPSRKLVRLFACILLVSEVAPKSLKMSPTFRPVPFKAVLKEKAQEIQSDITQMYDENASFLCDHYPAFSCDPANTVVFVWASEQETHAMRDCLYQEMIRIGMCQDTFCMQKLFPTFKFCNKSVNADKAILKLDHKGFYVNDTKNYGWVEAEQSSLYQCSNTTFALLSRANVRPLNHVGDHLRTFVCNSMELTQSKTWKLQQSFFSVVGNSSEVILKSSRNASARVTLDFDILTLSASRIGALNDSNVELFSLTDLQVACKKLDQYGLNTKTNEVTDIDTIGEHSISSKAILVEDKLRIRVNFSIPFVSVHSFGSYACQTYCKFQMKNSVTRYGCRQRKYFSIVFDDWRDENTAYIRDCMKDVTEIEKRYAAVIEDMGYYMWSVLITFCAWLLRAICKSIRECWQAWQNINTDVQLFTSMLTSVLREMVNNDNTTTKYDVFLSYSSKDRPWVQSTLLNFIESQGFKVCFGERDFPFGCSIPHTTENSVFASRKTIAVLSPDYMKSGWCLDYEYRLVLTKIMNKEATPGSLLVLKYRDCQMLPSMKMFTYLDYTKAYDDNRSVVMKVLSYIFPFLKRIDPDQTQFFDDLLLWLKQSPMEELINNHLLENSYNNAGKENARSLHRKLHKFSKIAVV